MSARRRCLVVAPVFPPSGLPPAHRARLFVRHLPVFGWDPIVVTVDPRDREDVPEAALAAHVPSDVPVETVRALPAWLTRRFGIGDVALRGFVSLARRAVAVGRREGVSAVLLIAPPWYGVMLAPRLKRALRVPVVVDYLDPWDVGTPRNRKQALAARVAARAEGRSLAHVDGVFAVSPGIVDRLHAHFPFLRDRPSGAAGYGFEPTDFNLVPRSNEPEQDRAHDGVVRLVYIGAVSESQRVVMEALLDAVCQVRDADAGACASLRVECYGTSYARPGHATLMVAPLAAARGLTACVVERPERLPYAEALTRMARSDANLIVGDLTTYYAASKLMPVLAAGRPLMAILREDTEPAELLRGAGAEGLVCYGNAAAPTPHDAVPAMVRILQQLMHRQIPPISPHVLHQDAFRARSAEYMTGALARVLDAAVGT